MTWREESRTTRNLLAVERGQRIGSWTQRVDANGGSFGQQALAGSTWSNLGWWNNAGASRGAAAHYLALPSSPAAAHTVHLRLNLHSNRSSSYALGPATAVHAGGAGNPGNCYFVAARFVGGISRVYLQKCIGGSAGTFAVVPFAVHEGDILSLAYRWNLSASRAELAALVNGVVVASATDTSSPFDLATLAARPGLWGDDDPALAGGDVGHWSTEWWVTDQFGSFERLPPVFPDLVGDLRLEMRTAQRYADDPSSRIKFLFSGEVLDAKWSMRRNGGCQSLQATFRPQQDTVVNPDVCRYFEDPSSEDWDANDWLGGLVNLCARYTAVDIAANPAIDERLWTGRISSVEVDRVSGEISIEAEGLSVTLDEYQIYADFNGITIRDAIVYLIRDNVAKGQRSEPWRGGEIRFNPAKITGVGSVLDYPIHLEFRWESASSVLERLLRLLPDGFVWGVDRLGEFYLSYQLDNYAADMGASGNALSLQTFDTASADRWTRKIDLSDIRNEILVIGAEDETAFSGSRKILGYALSKKSVELFGTRQDVVQENEAADVGIAAKMAQATCKRSASPRITAELATVEPVRGLKSFWDSLVEFAPAVAVIDRTVPQNIQETGMPRRAEFNLRRYGDEPAYAVAENGATGWVELPIIPADEIGQDFLLHQALRFTHAHLGGAGTFAFIFGRPLSTAARRGWGGLYWERDTGKLLWCYENAAHVQVAFDTGITVNPTTPANQVVHFTLAREDTVAGVGNWRAYNGGGLTGTLPHNNPPTNTGEPWRWFRPSFTGGGADVPWRGTLDQFWWFDGHVVVDGVNEGISGQHAGGYQAFAIRNNQRNLARNDAIGLLAHAKFNEDLAESFSNGRGHKVWRAAGAENLGRGVAVRTTYASATSPLANGTAVTPTGQHGGHLIGRPKRWGGPLRLNVETATYSLIPSSGRVRRELSLGEAPISAVGTVARVEAEVRDQAELLRRTGIP